MRRIARDIWIAIVLLTANFALFIVLYIAKRQLAPSEIIFFEGIAVAAISSLLFVLGCVLFRRNTLESSRDLVFLFVAGFFLNYAFMITFPTLLDRSISITMISVVDRAPGGQASLRTLNDSFLRTYVAGDMQTRKRVAEQIATGNFRAQDGGVAITERGKIWARANRAMATVFNIPRTYVDAKPASN